MDCYYNNDHHAYAIIEADSDENALMSVPPLFRDKAKAIKLSYFKVLISFMSKANSFCVS
jgi:hypothetical protein